MAKSAISKKPVEAKAAASKDVKEKKAKKSKKEPTPPPVPSSSSEDESEDSEEESKAAQVKTIPAKAGAEEVSFHAHEDTKDLALSLERTHRITESNTDPFVSISPLLRRRATTSRRPTPR
jgi:hypothetical protein